MSFKIKGLTAALGFFLPCFTFAAINWNIEYNNSSDKAVVITVENSECFRLKDFSNYVVIPKHSKLMTLATEKNSSTCNGTFYAKHELNLKVTFLDKNTQDAIFTKNVTYKSDFSNAPLTKPKTLLITNDGEIIRHNNDDSYGAISASKSDVYGKIVIDYKSDLIPVIDKITK